MRRSPRLASRRQSQTTVAPFGCLFLPLYPHLLTLQELKTKHPWTWERLTYPYVTTGYRAPTYDCLACVHSLFTLHNETFNGLSHWAGNLVSLVLLVHTIQLLGTDTEGCFVLSLYCVSAAFMLTFSASYHTFCCHSDQGSRVAQCCDWLGIAIHTFSCNLVVSYVEINSVSRQAFLVFNAVNLAFAVVSYSITYSALQKVYKSFDDSEIDDKLPRAKRDQHKKDPPSSTSSFSFFKPLLAITETYAFRTIVGCTYALGCMLAWVIGWVLSQDANDHLLPILAIYACFLTVILCLFDLPEKLLPPGTVDLFGFSHQIFHVGILAGVFSLYFYFLQLIRDQKLHPKE